MSLPKIKISADVTGHGSIQIDGVEVNGAIGVDVRLRAGEPTQVFLELVGDVEIEVDAGEVVRVMHGPACMTEGCWRKYPHVHGVDAATFAESVLKMSESLKALQLTNPIISGPPRK